MRLSIALLTISVLFTACAQQSEEAATPETSTVSISIPSAQCGTCENAITKALTKNESVADVSVDMEAKTVSVTYASASISLEDLESIITKAGYEANEKKADPEAYENLPACCKLPDDEGEMDMDSM